MLKKLFNLSLPTIFLLNSSVVFSQAIQELDTTKFTNDNEIKLHEEADHHVVGISTGALRGAVGKELYKKELARIANPLNDKSGSSEVYNFMAASNDDESKNEPEGEAAQVRGEVSCRSINISAISEEFNNSCNVLTGSALVTGKEFSEIGSLLALSSPAVFEISSNKKQCSKCYQRAAAKLNVEPKQSDKEKINQEISKVLFEKAIEKEVSKLSNSMELAIRSMALREDSFNSYAAKNSLSDEDKSKLREKLSCNSPESFKEAIKTKCGGELGTEAKSTLGRILGISKLSPSFEENLLAKLQDKTEKTKNSTCKEGYAKVSDLQKSRYVASFNNKESLIAKKHMDKLINNLKSESSFKQELCSSSSPDNITMSFRTYMSSNKKNESSINKIFSDYSKEQSELNNTEFSSGKDAMIHLFKRSFSGDSMYSYLLINKKSFCNEVLSTSRSLSEITERGLDETLESFNKRQVELMKRISEDACNSSYESLAEVACKKPESFLDENQVSSNDIREASKFVFNKNSNMNTKDKMIIGQKVCSLKMRDQTSSLDIGYSALDQKEQLFLSNFTKEFISEGKSISPWEQDISKKDKLRLVNELADQSNKKVCLDEENDITALNYGVREGLYKIPPSNEEINTFVASSIASGSIDMNSIPKEYLDDLSKDYDFSTGKRRNDGVSREIASIDSGVSSGDSSEAPSNKSNLLNSLGSTQVEPAQEDSSAFYNNYRNPASKEDSIDQLAPKEKFLGEELVGEDAGDFGTEGSSKNSVLNNRIEELNKQIAEIEKNNKLLQEKLLKAKESKSDDLDDIERQIKEDEKKLAEMKSEKRGLERKLASNSNGSSFSSEPKKFEKSNVGSNSNSQIAGGSSSFKNGGPSSSGPSQSTSAVSPQSYNNVSYNKIQLVKVSSKVIDSLNKIEDFSNTRVQTTMIGGKSVITAVLVDEGWVDIQELPEDIRLKILSANEGKDLLGQEAEREIASEKPLEKPIEVEKNPGLFDSLNSFLKKNVDVKE